MRVFKELFRAKSLFIIVLMLGLLTGCLDQKKTNTDDVTYTPETRKLGVIAGDGADYSPGAQVTLTGRLTGTVTNETVLWEQIEGTPVQNVTNWTTPALTFKAPVVDGIEALKFQISARNSAGAIINDADGKPLVDQVSINVFDPSILVTIQVEDTNFVQLNGLTLVGQGDANYINGATGTHTPDISPGTGVKYTIPSGSKVGDKTLSAGFYTLYVQYAIPTSYGGKTAQATVNGVTSDMPFNATSAWEKFRVGTIKLNDGDNTIEIGGGWNYYRIDSISLIPAPAPAKPLAVPSTVVDPNATSATKDLMAFLVSSYGSKTLSGQTEYMDYSDSAKTGLREFDKVVAATGGDAPAITAFDFIDYSSSRVACGAKPGTLSEDMIAAHKQKNVILAPLWHWNAPTKLKDTTCTGSGDTAWWSGFYSTATTFDLKAALADPTGVDYLALIADIDKISLELKKFSDAGIPLLWRPLHEAQGGWFWWGKSGPDELQALWKIMHDRMTNVNGLHNLIWVFTYSGTADATWYPGDDYVDIVGYDGYDGKNANNPFKSQFATIKNRHDGKKLVGLTETGTIPNIESMQKENAWWAFFVTWNSTGSTEYGPANADPAVVKASYAFAGTLNLDDVPGGRTKVEAGLYEGFEIPITGWDAQINWAATSGLTASSSWATSGVTSLALTKNLSLETAPTGVVFQTYPTTPISLTSKTTLKVSVNSTNSGAGTTAKLWVKDGSSVWHDSGAISISGPTVISLNVSTFDKLTAIGVQFENFDASSTAANFYLDQVQLDQTVLSDFEPATSDWSAQVNWADTPGATVSTAWKADGQRALALTKNLSKETAPTGVIFQKYEALPVGTATTLSVTVNAVNSGASTTAKLWIKDASSVWHDSGSTAIAGATTLSLDLTSFANTSLTGIGVQFEGFDPASTAAEFYLDSVKLGTKTIYDFEGTGAWEFQVNWSPATGIQLATDWAKSGAYSLAGATQLKTGDDNVILQTYPAGNLLLGSVTHLKISTHVTNAGSAVTAQLFAKDKSQTWHDGGEVNLVGGSAELTLDVSTLGEISGFGVRFQHAANDTTESKYYIDDIKFD